MGLICLPIPLDELRGHLLELVHSISCKHEVLAARDPVVLGRLARLVPLEHLGGLVVHCRRQPIQGQLLGEGQLVGKLDGCARYVIRT